MLSSRVPDLRALEMLTTLGRTGSIARTALELRISQQAVSARLRRLESALGVPLAVRGARDTVLTSEGRKVAAWSRTLLDAAERLDGDLGTLIGDGATVVRVAASMTVAEFLLPHWLVTFGARRERLGRAPVEVEVTATNTGRAASLVAAGACALGFVEGPVRPEGLGYRALAEDELVVVARPDHLWVREGSVDPVTLAATPLVMREPGSGCRDVLAAALVRAGVTRALARPVIELPSNTAIAETVSDGMAAAAISVRAVGHLLRSGRLARVQTPGLDLHRVLGAVWRGGAEPSDPLARDLLAACGATGKLEAAGDPARRSRAPRAMAAG